MKKKKKRCKILRAVLGRNSKSVIIVVVVVESSLCWKIINNHIYIPTIFQSDLKITFELTQQWHHCDDGDCWKKK